MKENLKPCVYKLWNYVKVGPRTFCRTARRVAFAGEVKDGKCGAGGKPSLNRANQSVRAGPNRGALSMSRLKPP